MTGGSYEIRCDDCGEKIRASARYCPDCGERQPWFTDRRAQLTPLKTISLLGVAAVLLWITLAVYGVVV